MEIKNLPGLRGQLAAAGDASLTSGIEEDGFATAGALADDFGQC
jgi:hypothetical protein